MYTYTYTCLYQNIHTFIFTYLNIRVCTDTPMTVQCLVQCIYMRLLVFDEGGRLKFLSNDVSSQPTVTDEGIRIPPESAEGLLAIS